MVARSGRGTAAKGLILQRHPCTSCFGAGVGAASSAISAPAIVAVGVRIMVARAVVGAAAYIGRIIVTRKPLVKRHVIASARSRTVRAGRVPTRVVIGVGLVVVVARVLVCAAAPEILLQCAEPVTAPGVQARAGVVDHVRIDRVARVRLFRHRAALPPLFSVVSIFALLQVV